MYGEREEILRVATSPPSQLQVGGVLSQHWLAWVLCGADVSTVGVLRDGYHNEDIRKPLLGTNRLLMERSSTSPLHIVSNSVPNNNIPRSHKGHCQDILFMPLPGRRHPPRLFPFPRIAEGEEISCGVGGCGWSRSRNF